MRWSETTHANLPSLLQSSCNPVTDDVGLICDVVSWASGIDVIFVSMVFNVRVISWRNPLISFKFIIP